MVGRSDKQLTLKTKKNDSNMSFLLFVGNTMANIRLRRSKKTASTSTRGPLLPPLLDFLDDAAAGAGSGMVVVVDDEVEGSPLVGLAFAFAAALFFGLMTPRYVE